MNIHGHSLSLLFFLSVVMFVDTLGIIINGFFLAILSSLFTPGGAIVAGAGAFLTFFEAYIINFGFTETAVSVLVAVGSAPFLVSLIAITVFYSFVLTAPRRKFSLFECLLALGVFLLESFPFMSAFPLWSGFAFFLWRRHFFSGRKR